MGQTTLDSMSCLSSLLSTWNVRSITEVHCRQRMTNVLGLGRSVFISWHSTGHRHMSEKLKNWGHTRTQGFNLAFTEMWQPEGKLTCDREVVEWWEAVVTRHLRLLFVTNEGTVALQDEVTRTPCFNVFTWKEEADTFSGANWLI